MSWTRGNAFGTIFWKVLMLLTSVTAIELDVTSPDSIKRAASIAADNAWSFYWLYNGGNIPGLLVQPYYWWENGAMFGLMVQRWSLTGNDTRMDEVKRGTLFQVGEDRDFRPSNQSASLGNDDQLYWALNTLDMVEQGFDNPDDPDDPSWLGLVQAVFNEQAAEWDDATCGGGMRWQIVPVNLGYNYKNIMANGGFFQLAARLARYTGNETYAWYAEKTYDWLSQSSLFDNSTKGRIHVWDGFHIEDCDNPSKVDWSYNSATLIVGSAFLWNYYNNTGNSTQETLTLWETRIDLLMKSTDVFYQTSKNPDIARIGPDVLIEGCELPEPQICDQDQPVFKAFTTRWMALTAIMAPWTNDTIYPRLVASAEAAAQACVGNTNDAQQQGTSCGRRWTQVGFDGHFGVGEQLSAMSAFQSLLLGVKGVGGKGPNGDGTPYTALNGGTSKSDPGAGIVKYTGAYVPPAILYREITTGDKAGAAILTIFGVVSFLGILGWGVSEIGGG